MLVFSNYAKNYASTIYNSLIEGGLECEMAVRCLLSQVTKGPSLAVHQPQEAICQKCGSKRVVA